MDSPALFTEELTRDFDTVRAVDALSLSVPRGTLFGFLGPNGAGKTTTIRLLLGLLTPSSGQAKVLGFDTGTEGQQIRENVGALLEHTGLYEQLSAEENLEFFGRAADIPVEVRRHRIKEALHDLELWDRRTEPVGKWSRGMRQKVALARVLLSRPKLVLLDEPTNGLDVVAAAAVRNALRLMVELDGVTVMLTTHNMPEAERLCDEIAVVRQGKMLAAGKPDQLRMRYASPCLEVSGTGFDDDVLNAIRDIDDVRSLARNNGHIEIEFDSDIDAAPIVSMLVDKGVAIQEVRKRRVSLEEAFLAIMERE